MHALHKLKPIVPTLSITNSLKANRQAQNSSFQTVSAYLVLKFAGWGCPSYKDKKSYSSSTAKDWKTKCILLLSSATITHVQFAPLGYPWGKPGLSMVPFFPFNVPPHVKMKPVKREKEKKIWVYKCHNPHIEISQNVNMKHLRLVLLL